MRHKDASTLSRSKFVLFCVILSSTEFKTLKLHGYYDKLQKKKINKKKPLPIMRNVDVDWDTLDTFEKFSVCKIFQQTGYLSAIKIFSQLFEIILEVKIPKLRKKRWKKTSRSPLIRHGWLLLYHCYYSFLYACFSLELGQRDALQWRKDKRFNSPRDSQFRVHSATRSRKIYRPWLGNLPLLSFVCSQALWIIQDFFIIFLF